MSVGCIYIYYRVLNKRPGRNKRHWGANSYNLIKDMGGIKDTGGQILII